MSNIKSCVGIIVVVSFFILLPIEPRYYSSHPAAIPPALDAPDPVAPSAMFRVIFRAMIRFEMSNRGRAANRSVLRSMLWLVGWLVVVVVVVVL